LTKPRNAEKSKDDSQIKTNKQIFCSSTADVL